MCKRNWKRCKKQTKTNNNSKYCGVQFFFRQIDSQNNCTFHTVLWSTWKHKQKCKAFMIGIFTCCSDKSFNSSAIDNEAVFCKTFLPAITPPLITWACRSSFSSDNFRFWSLSDFNSDSNSLTRLALLSSGMIGNPLVSSSITSDLWMISERFWSSARCASNWKISVKWHWFSLSFLWNRK